MVKPFFSLLEDYKTVKVWLGEDKKIEKVETNLEHRRRDIEDLCKGKTWQQALPLVERICGICSLAHTNAFVRALEGVAGVSAPRRANYIRVIYSEMERITSHALWFALVAEDVGLDFKPMYKAREIVLNLLEKTRGLRIHPNVQTVGGVVFDLTENNRNQIARSMKEFRDAVSPLFEGMLSNENLVSKLEGLARISKKDVEGYGLVGPLARASGVSCDERLTGYFAYEDLRFSEILGTKGDSLERLKVRMDEVLHSVDLIEEAVRALPPGNVREKVSSLTGKRTGTCEAPRGVNTHVVEVKEDVITNLEITTPTNRNLSVLPKLLVGLELEQLSPTFLTIDPCYTCAERIIVVENGREWIYGQASSH